MLIMLGFESVVFMLTAWIHHLPYHKFRLLYIPLLITIIHIVATSMLSVFSPLSSGLLFIIGISTLHTHFEHLKVEGTYIWTEILIWILLLLPREINWALFSPHETLSYDWWSMASAIFLLVGWKALRSDPMKGYEFVPNGKDIIVFFLGGIFFLLGAVILVFFFKWEITFEKIGVWTYVGSFIRMLFASNVATEIFFRCVLFELVEKFIKREHISNVITSVIYGLFFWNHSTNILFQVCWILFGLVTGFVYGNTYVATKKIIAASLLHTMVDFILIWFFKLESNHSARLHFKLINT